jgi:hypothetical protein
MVPADDDPADVMSAVDASVPVELVASFGLEVLEADQPLADALRRLEQRHFDYGPVRLDGVIIGVLEHDGVSHPRGKTVGDAMRPLSDRMLVAATDPLVDVIDALAKAPHYRLVLKNLTIQGIVTVSDVQRLAVRSLLFSRVTHVELLLARWLRRKCGDQDGLWLATLSEGRQAKLREQLRQLQKEDMAVDLLTASQFCDKRDAALKLGAFADRSVAKRRLKSVEELRNQIAHANGDYGRTLQRALRVIGIAQDARTLIEELRDSLGAIPSRVDDGGLTGREVPPSAGAKKVVR